MDSEDCVLTNPTLPEPPTIEVYSQRSHALLKFGLGPSYCISQIWALRFFKKTARIALGVLSIFDHLDHTFLFQCFGPDRPFDLLPE